MSMYVSLEGVGQDAMLEFARERVGETAPWPAHAIALGVYTRDNTLCAVLVTVETYNKVIDIHFASDETRIWGSRRVLAMIFAYLFEFRRARRIQTWHPVSAKHTTSIVLRVGFSVEGTLRDAIDKGEDAVLFAMTPQECIWLQKHSKEGSTHG